MAKHDQRMKVLLREFFPEFLDLFFADVAALFLFPVENFIDKELIENPPGSRQRLLDLIAQLVRKDPPPDQPQRGLIHVEIESADSRTDLKRRLPGYYESLKQQSGLPVLPLCLYLDVGLDGLGQDYCEDDFFGRPVRRLTYSYVGLPALDALEYLQGKNVLGVALSALMRPPPQGRARLKAQALLRIARCGESDERKFLLAECIEAYLLLEGAQQAEFDDLMASQTYADAKQMAVTSFEKGLEQGLEKGLEQGRRELLLLQLEARFGALPAAVRQQVSDRSGDALRDLACRILNAASLEELGLV